MKKIEAIIRQEKLKEVSDALTAAGLWGLTAYEVLGRGRQKGVSLSNRTSEYRIDMLPKMKIELAVEDKDVDKAIETIVSSARTGDIGDGKIFVYASEGVIRIRTGEKGSTAI
jgi:nitrogen regulatory protein PII